MHLATVPANSLMSHSVLGDKLSYTLPPSRVHYHGSCFFKPPRGGLLNRTLVVAGFLIFAEISEMLKKNRPEKPVFPVK